VMKCCVLAAQGPAVAPISPSQDSSGKRRHAGGGWVGAGWVVLGARATHRGVVPVAASCRQRGWPLCIWQLVCWCYIDRA
jgi:hypothetical protein